MKKWISLPVLFVCHSLLAQNVGVGIVTPLQKLHVVAGLSGNIQVPEIPAKAITHLVLHPRQ